MRQLFILTDRSNGGHALLNNKQKVEFAKTLQKSFKQIRNPGMSKQNENASFSK